MLRFFIDRPIFASVISIIIMLVGLAALRALPVEQYPDVVPPQVVVEAAYPGASSTVIAEAVAAPLEQEINGVDNMLYMESTSTDAGSLQITISFAMGTDPDQAAINVNNRVQAALSRLPQQVQTLGVRVEARSNNILMVPVLFSPDGSRDVLFMSNYALLNVLDELVRIPGVGDASLFGAQDYSMRIWLSPDKLAQFDLTPNDVAAAIREQNAQFAAGSLGAEPAPEGQAFTFSVTTQGQLSDPEEFEAIILRAEQDGSTLRLGDVARAELGAQNYAFSATYNGQSAVPMGVYLQPGANALETATAVREALEDLLLPLPGGARLYGALRHHRVRGDLHPRGVHLPADRRGAGGGGDLHVPPALARHPDSGGGDSGIADRHLRRHAGLRLLGQPADALRSGAGHRYRGG